MRTTFLYLLNLGVALLLLSGCVRSDHPLSNVKDARPDLRLAGTWHPKLKRKVRDADVVVSYDAQGLGHAVSQHDGSTTSVNGFFITQTDKGSYINVPDAGDAKKAGKPQYQFFKYAVSKDQETMRLWPLKLATFQKAVREKRLKGHLEANGNNTNLPQGMHEQDAVLEDSPEALLRFLETMPPGDVFEEVGVYQRVH